MGKMSRDKGAAWERRLAGYLRPSFPRIDRAVRTGYATADRTAADPGDLAGTDYIIWSAKDVTMPHGKVEPQPNVLRGWFAELDAMVAGSPRTPTPVGLIVHKRSGYLDPGMAWCWMTAEDFGRLLGIVMLGVSLDPAMPVRVQLDDLLPALVAWERRWNERAA